MFFHLLGKGKSFIWEGEWAVAPPDSSWNTGEMQVPRMALGTNLVVSKDLVVCGWGWPESLLNREKCSGLARESSWGGPHCLALGAIMGWGPCSCPGCVQQVLGDQEGLGKNTNFLIYQFLIFCFFFIYWSIDFTGDFLLRDINKQDLSLRDGGFFPGVGEI